MLDNDTLVMIRNRNLFDNGGMVINQRGTTALTSGNGAYTVDRWKVADSDVSCSGTVSTAANTGFRSGYAMQIIATHTNGIIYISQRIESYRAKAYYGKNITVGVRVYHNFGATTNFYLQAATPNAQDNFGAVTLLATSSAVACSDGTFTDLAFTFSAGTTNIVNGLLIQLFNTANTVTTKTLSVGDFVGDEGDVLSVFPNDPPAIEFTRCLRYYQTGAPFGLRGTASGANNLVAGSLQWKVPMRTTPTNTFSVVSSTNVSGSPSVAQNNGFGMSASVGSAAAGDFYYFATVTSDAEL